MLKPEEVLVCLNCGCVTTTGRLLLGIGGHRNEYECDEAKTLAEYVREYGQEQRGLGYDEGAADGHKNGYEVGREQGQEDAREPQGDRG